MSQIIDFYEDKCGNAEGDMLQEILQWSNYELEVDHDYIQFLFPSNEASQMNVNAPVITKEECEYFQANLKDKIKTSFIRILDFLQFRLIEDKNFILVEPIDNQTLEWIKSFNHNFLRTTRILKCLRLTGNEQYAIAFYNGLRNFKHLVSKNSWSYWEKAIFDPLWS